jgi:hypothetical protein
MSKHHVDLKHYFNYRLVYPQNTEVQETDTDNYKGITNNFFFEEDFDFKKLITTGNEEFIFERNKDLNDCIECRQTVVEVPDIDCKRISLAGISTWGMYKEKFKLIFDDGSSDNAIGYFADVAWPVHKYQQWFLGIEKEAMLDGSKILCGPKKAREHEFYIYHYSTEFEKTRKLKKIIFPDNIFMYIFAITLED